MSDILANDFSWSQSRDRSYQKCLRRYYYDYYGHWGGWESHADPQTREIWILKSMQSRQMWVGGLVHDVVETTLRYTRQNYPAVPSADELAQAFVATMREQFKASRDGQFRKTGRKATRLFEHEFDVTVADSSWRELRDMGVRAIRNFVASDTLREILAVHPDEWMPIERFEHFHLDDIKVNVKIDFAYRDGDLLHIIDWKTGSRQSEPATIQLGCYALFALEKWSAEIGKIRTAEVNLTRGEIAETQIADEDLQGTREYIRDSAASMLRRLNVPERNEARIDNFAKVEELRICRWCNFQRVCLGGTANELLKNRARGRA